MKKMLGLDQGYEQLKEIGVLGTDFTVMSYPLVRKYIQTLMFVHLNGDQYKQMLKMLNSENKDSKSTLKILILLNISIHQSVKQDKIEFDPLIVDQLNLLMSLENSRFEGVHKKRNKEKQRGLSLEKTVSWIKEGIRETFSKSKEKTNQMRSNSSFNRTQLVSRVATQVTQNFDPPNVRSERVGEQTEVKGKQQILICDLIIPYATYLLKLTSSGINLEKEFGLPNLKTEHLWKIVNLLNYLLRVSSAFNTIMRYYKSDYQKVVEGTVRSMDHQIKLLYPLLERSINKKFELFKKQTLQIYRQEANSKAKIEKIQEVIYKYQVNELKEIILQISRINEEIHKIYLGKYTYHKIKAMSIAQPSLISDSSFDLIYDVFKEVEKSKSISKRQSVSREKKEKQSLFVAKPQQPPSMVKSTIAQKKLKIVSNDERRERKITPKKPADLSQTAPVQNENQSTFRRMRMNMTSTHISLEQSNTRRLRL